MTTTRTPAPSATFTATAGGAMSTSTLDRARLAHDASHYLLTPSAVVTATSTDQVARILAAASASGTPVTFRAGGTSLSGQASTDGVLIDVRRHLAAVEVLDDGARVRCQPGAVLRRVNAALAPYGRRLGPDPASEIACTIGGIVANNSSGMTSGTAATTYRTLDSMVLVLPSGTVVDTAAPDADRMLRERERPLYEGLVRLRDQVRSSPAQRSRIEQQFSLKNTMGYGLNALLDHDDPVDILAHLLVGSEGTLGYVAEVVLRTVPAQPHAATALCVFDTIDHATDAVIPLTEAGAAAVELLDASSLRVSQRDPRAPQAMRAISVAEHTALLVEVQAATAEELEDAAARLRPVIGGLTLAAPAELTCDAADRAALWVTRKVLYAAVAGARPPGTTALLEDVVVPPSALPGTVRELGRLLGRHGYDDAVIFGHAKDANLHFQINPHLDVPAELQRYAAFTEDLVDLVLGADGSLKAEHGTGRMMAPYVERQYGPELYDVMRRLKHLCDPAGVLNPGVLIDDDPRAHLKNLKPFPAVHSQLDRCVECGYCEPACPSRNTTTTPRQRIVLLREMALSDPARLREISAEYDYQAVQTCAADSLCVTACPVGIDTGEVMKSYRAAHRGPVAKAAGHVLAEGWGPTTAVLRKALTVAERLPAPVLPAVTRGLRGVVGEQGRDWLPQVGAHLPGAGRSRRALVAEARAEAAADAQAEPAASAGGATDPPPRASRGDVDAQVPATDAVFFPSCIGSIFSAEDGTAGAGAAFLRLAARAGLAVVVPAGIDQLCCGTVWESKGLLDGAAAMARKVADQVWDLTDDGRIPLVCDASSCTHGLAGIGKRLTGEAAGRWASVEVVDAVTFTKTTIMPALGPVPEQDRLGRIAVHPTCSAVHLGTVGDLTDVARAVARDVLVPKSWGCCGTAGDRGMLHPELPAGATESEAAEIARAELTRGALDGYVSCNRTCEMGMTDATGRPYRHVLEALEEVTR